MEKPKPPFVYIAGAGPGDPQLLTLKVHRLITQIADVVVYDRLIPDEIISMIPDRVKRVYAGKSCRQHHMTQDEINACLVEHAQQNNVVVRLKGGDPFIFGRGGEEALCLAEHSIPFDIIPGVNAADGCAAYLGIPLTHRGIATAVRFITAHQQQGKQSQLHWPDLVDEKTTLVIYMGLTRLDDIANQLIAHGMDESMPAVAISHGTTAKQKATFTTLEQLFSVVQKEGYISPTLVIIGRVVALGEKIKS